jgi:hypothetical protein
MGPILFTYLISIAFLLTAGSVEILGHAGMIGIGVNETGHITGTPHDLAFSFSMVGVLLTSLFILRRVCMRDNLQAKIQTTLLEHFFVELCYMVIIMYKGSTAYEIADLMVSCGLFFSVIAFRVVHEVVLLRETENFSLTIEHPSLQVQASVTDVKLDAEEGSHGEQLEQTESPPVHKLKLTPELWRYYSPAMISLLILPLVWLQAWTSIMWTSIYLRHLVVIHSSYHVFFHLLHTVISMLPSYSKVCAYESARAYFDFVWVVSQTSVVVSSTYLLIEK